MFETLLTFAYSICGSVILLFYFPQIFQVAKSETGAKDVSLIAWATWAGCNIISALYAWMIPKDWKIALFALLNATLCAIVTVITIQKRQRLKKG